MQDPLDNIQDKERAAELIAKHLQGALSDLEQLELEAWIGADEWHRTYFHRCTDPAYLDQLMADYHKAADMEVDLRTAIQLKMGQQGEKFPPGKKISLFPAWARVAAAVILLSGIGIYFWNTRTAHQAAVVDVKPAPSIPAGRQGAILTLADGKQLTLDSLPNGVVADQNGSQAAVIDGKLAYHPVSAPTPATTTYNAITTPRGRQYQLTLPDGTKVWLNAASRIVFPTTFTGAERKVTIEGEAYFEVARNTDRPFKVTAGGSVTEVLGTSFNINAYNDERDTRTTLLDGSVKVSGRDTGVVLKPGQQAAVGAQLRVKTDVNIEQVIAWKNGLFYFNSTDITTIMQQLSRWYDIDVRYEGKVPDIRITGKMDKGLNLDDILEWLSKNEVKQRLLGRTVIISNN